MGIRNISFILVVSTFIVIACNKIMPEAPQPNEILAGPITELSAEQKANHLKGDAEFSRAFGVLDGLGPVFVSTSCESCHAGDGKGHLLTTLTRFCKFDGEYYDMMEENGGPQLQHRSIAGYIAEEIPSEASGVTKLVAPSVSGLGYLEAVDDATILALADPSDKNGDGISGIPAFIVAPDYYKPHPNQSALNGKYIGRFGRKASSIDLLHQTANAYINDIGITSDYNPVDLYNHTKGRNSGDDVADPEIGSAVIHNVAFYMRTLKAPERRNTNDGNVVAGEMIFKKIGCEGCHISQLKTGKSDISALSHKTFYPYTDLLLHDMGSELDDNYTEGSALPSEWRTTPLWGLGLSKDSQGGVPNYLHDGRAKTLSEAIELHGGEGALSRENFRKLSQQEKEQLYKFLESL